MKVVITKREVEEIRPKYRPKYKDESLEIMRQNAILEKEKRDKVYKFSRYENNNHIFRGKNILDNKPISATVRRYLGPPGSVVEGQKIPSNDHFNPLEEIPLNLLSSDAIRYIYDENDNIQCSVNPSNLVAPIKINDKLRHDNGFRSSTFNSDVNGAIDTTKAMKAMNPLFFDQNTETQNKKSFIPDLLYHNEMDKVDSLHNAISNPHSFIPPPIVKDPKSVMTCQNLNNENYYPTGNNFFNKDPFKCYITTLNLIDQMSKDKPAHLKQYDRRYLNDGNLLTIGNVLYTNKPMSPLRPTSPKLKEDACTSPLTPVQESPSVIKPSISVQNPSVSVSHRPSNRQQVYLKNPSDSESPDYSPESIQHPKLPNYPEDRRDQQWRKELPDRKNEEVKESNKKRVVFEDQKKKKKEREEREYAQSSGIKTQSSVEKERKPIQNYDHFHDESMSKLEAVLQRQRERLENMGGFSGKSSQISKKSENSEQKLEDAYKDLEKEIYNIKRNLEASQNSDGNGYTPMKFGENSQLRTSGQQNELDLSPSDLEGEDEDDHPQYSM